MLRLDFGTASPARGLSVASRRGKEGFLTGLWHSHPAHRYLSGILVWRGGLLSTLWHGDPQQNHFWGRVTWQDCLDPVSNRSLADASAKRTSIDPLARGPLPQAPRWHPRVAKGTSIDPLARGPSTEPLLGHGHVARLSGSGVKPVSCRCFGRTSLFVHEMPLFHGH